MKHRGGRIAASLLSLAGTLSVALLAVGFLAGCGGGGGGGSSAPPTTAPTSLSYGTNPASYRVGKSISTNQPSVTGGSPTAYAVLPALPSGLVLDTGNGRITGAPLSAAATADYEVTASNSFGSAQATLSLQVTPALPNEVVSLAAGFEISKWAGSLSVPVKMAFAPDGRLFFNELTTGKVRVHDGTQVLPTAFATLPVLNGAEQGLLGLTLAPDFATSGFVYVFASTPADAMPGHFDRNRVVRYTASGNVGTNMTVLIDDLPTGNVHNSGDVKIGPDGALYVTLGDVNDSSLPQTDGVKPGRVLRYTAAGGIPADNPIAGNPEWCRGLRNTFDITFHPTTGGLFGSENGPTSQDEINFLQAGKNYGWPTSPGGPTVGFRITDWTPVIAPTGIAFYTGTGFGAAFQDNLFVAGYVDADLRRLVLSGPALTDLDAEIPFATFDNTGGVNKPLDIVEGADGAVYVSTFDAIWKIKKSP